MKQTNNNRNEMNSEEFNNESVNAVKKIANAIVEGVRSNSDPDEYTDLLIDSKGEISEEEKSIINTGVTLAAFILNKSDGYGFAAGPNYLTTDIRKLSEKRDLDYVKIKEQTQSEEEINEFFAESIEKLTTGELGDL